MNKKISLGAALALMLIITAVTFSVTMIFSRQMFSTTITNISEKQAMYDKLSEIDSYVRQNYYGTIDETNLNDYISTGYIAGLSDRYAAYYSASDYSALQQMNTDYPIETRTLIERMLQLGPVNDPNISKKFLMFYQDSTLQNLISDAEAEYANMDDINEQLENAFQNLEKWIKDIHRPQFYAQIGALDQSIIVGENSVGISLDKYMGKDYPLYKKYYSQQQRESMRRDQIVPDCLMFYLMSVYPMDNFDTRTQLERDLHVAKIMWVVNKAMEKQALTHNSTGLWTST